jgi:hypothetical protein
VTGSHGLWVADLCYSLSTVATVIFEAIDEVYVCVDAMDGPRIVSVSMNFDVSSTDIYPDGPGCIHGRPYIIHVPVELELLAWGTIPRATALALAAPIGLPSCMPLPLHQPPQYSKQ